MASLKANTQTSTRQARAARPSASSRNVRVAAFKPAQQQLISSTQDDAVVSRRMSIISGLVVASAPFIASSPAQAFLGFGEPPLTEQYAKDTETVLANVKNVLALPRGDDSAEDKVKDLRKDINGWVAKYRREPQFSGKPSFGNTYSVLNALAGHFNSFGAAAPIPKKRLERIVKEIDDAERFLSRGR